MKGVQNSKSLKRQIYKRQVQKQGNQQLQPKSQKQSQQQL